MNQPGGPLRSARVARRWSQARVAEELAALALERGLAVAAPISLKTQLSRWENQRAVPEEHYRALLCTLYDSTEAELGLVEHPPAEDQPARDDSRLRADLSESAALDTEEIELLRAQLAATRRLDHRLGTAASAGTARAQLSHLERMLTHTVSSRARHELAHLVVDIALLVGEHSRDWVMPAEAWQHFATAKAAAHEAESGVLIGCAMVCQASVLLDIGEHRLATDLVEQALHLTDADAPGPILAWFSAARGRSWAVSGVAEQARTAYRLAERQLDGPATRIDISFPISVFLSFDLTALRRHRGHTELVLREDEAAIADLEHALTIEGGAARDVAGTHVDLAYAHGAVGHVEAAAIHAGQAREIVSRIGSPRLAQLLDQRHPLPGAPKFATRH
jgi:transcriptional regulator with XRE-family HTH domain